MRKRVNTKPTLQSISDAELVDHLLKAYYKQKEAIRATDFAGARAGLESVNAYRGEVLRRLASKDPVLHG